jgi:hypothetical protein
MYEDTSQLSNSLVSSVLFLVAVSLESAPLVLGILFFTFMSNYTVSSYTIDLGDDCPHHNHIVNPSKESVAVKQKYKCANFINDKEVEDYQCLLADGVFDEAGYKVCDGKAFCPMCYRVKKGK